MGSPSASLSSRSALALYAQLGSCPSYAHFRWLRPGIIPIGTPLLVQDWQGEYALVRDFDGRDWGWPALQPSLSLSRWCFRSHGSRRSSSPY